MNTAPERPYDHSYENYEVMESCGRGVILRQDPFRKRSVAIIGSPAHWGRFVAMLEAGADEVSAVKAIDEEDACV